MILGRAYFREVVERLLVVLGGVVFLIGLGAAIRATATSQGAPLWVPLSLVPLIVGQALPYFLPVAVLAAVILTYGRMAADREHLACFAAGKRPAALLMVAIVAGTGVASLGLPLASEVAPDLYRRMRELAARVPIAALENTDPGASELHFGGLHLSWRGRTEDGAFRDVLLSFRDPSVEPAGPEEGDAGGASQQVRADSARMRVSGGELLFTFRGVRTFSGSGEDSGWNLTNDGVTTLSVDLAALERRARPDVRAKDRSSTELRAALAEGAVAEEDRARIEYVLWQRRAMAAAILPLALIGALLGWRLRRSGILTALAAAFGVLLLLYYPAYFVGEALQENEACPPALAAWLPCLSLVPLLAWLWWRTERH